MRRFLSNYFDLLFLLLRTSLTLKLVRNSNNDDDDNNNNNNNNNIDNNKKTLFVTKTEV